MTSKTGFQRGAFKGALLACGAALALPMAGSTAFAQDANGEGEAYKNEILVTAQRRTERLEQVPMTVAALSADTMAAAGITSVRDISKAVTGVQIAQAGGFTQPAVRGISTLTNNVNFENNVAVYVDGFYEPSSQAINMDLPNVQDIQVLKGPQGTLYGRNATGGAILLNTRDPAKELTGKLELTYGRFDDKRASAYISGPITDTVGFSVAGYTRRSDGFVKYASPTTPGATAGNAAPMRQDAVRIKLKADLTDNLWVKLAYNYAYVNDPRFSLYSTYENMLASRNIPSRPTRLGVVASTFAPQLSSEIHQGTMTIGLDTGIGELKSYTSYAANQLINKFDFDGSYSNYIGSGGSGNLSTFSYTSNKQTTFQQAIDYSITAIDRLNLIVGANYFHDKLESNHDGANFGTTAYNSPLPALATFPLPDFSVMTPANVQYGLQKKTAWAVYADATFELADHLFLNAGARYSKETQDLTVYQQCIPAGTNCTGSATLVDGSYYSFVPTSGTFKYKQLTPRAGLRYELGARTNIYANYSKGFRPGAINTTLAGLTPATWRPIKQETVDAFELGFKTASSLYRLELAGFIYNFKNLQVSSTQTLCTPIGSNICTATNVLGNAPSARVKGLEASFEVYPTENFTVRGGAAYLNGRYGKFANATGTGVNPTGTVGIVVSTTNPLFNYPNQTQTQDWTGLQMARAPKFTANLGLEYNVPNGEGGLKFNGHANYTTSYVVTNPSIWCQPLASNGQCGAGTVNAIPVALQRKQRFRQAGYAMLSASVTWTDPKGHFYVQAYGNNLTDRRIKQHYTGTAAGTYYPMAEPRTYGARVGYKF